MRMYFLGSEHNPPHVHAIYGEDTAAFDIRTGEIIEGGMPGRAAGMIRDGFIPLTRIYYSPHLRQNRLQRPFSGVAATCPKTGTGYHPFSQVRAFTPHYWLPPW